MPLEDCLPLLPETDESREITWPEEWPERLNNQPPSVPTEESFEENSQQWKNLVTGTYMNELNIDWSTVRNVMDMNAGFGGYGAEKIETLL